MSIFDSKLKEIQMNAPVYRSTGKRVYKIFENNKLVWQDKHTPAYTWGTDMNTSANSQAAWVNQTEAVPYPVTYNIQVEHGYNVWAVEFDVSLQVYNITVPPNTTGVIREDRYVGGGSFATLAWQRGARLNSVTIGDE